MKDRRKYLLASGIIEYLYIVVSIVYALMTTKNTDELIATIFINILSFICATILIIQSTKDENYLSKKRSTITICSVILLFSSFVSGILGILYLRKPAKVKDIPQNPEEKCTNAQRIMSLVLFICFCIIMFVLPRFSMVKNIPEWCVYLFLFLITIAVSLKSLIRDAKDYFKNFRKYFPFVIKRYFIMLFFAFLAALVVLLITHNGVSNNQQLVNEMLNKKPFYAFVLSVIYAPLIEECIFRLNLKKVITNKIVFIIISGILFGLGHVVNSSASILDFVPVLQYSVLGICLAKAYSDTNNILVSISMHFIQNFLAALLVLFVL